MILQRYVVARASIDLKRTTLRIKDNGSNYLVVKFGEGNLTWSEKKNIIYTLDRGELDDVREGDQVPVEVQFTGLWEYLTGGAATSSSPTLEDALKGIGGAADWVSVDSDPCRPYAVDLELMYSPTPINCGQKEIITLRDFRWEELQHDLRGASIQCSGRCNVTRAEAVRGANSVGILS